MHAHIACVYLETMEGVLLVLLTCNSFRDSAVCEFESLLELSYFSCPCFIAATCSLIRGGGIVAAPLLLLLLLPADVVVITAVLLHLKLLLVVTCKK